MYSLVDRLQSKNRTICGAYCLYYLHNLYDPEESFKLGGETGDINLVKKLLKSIFVDVPDSELDKADNINSLIIEEFIDAYKVKVNTQDFDLLDRKK